MPCPLASCETPGRRHRSKNSPLDGDRIPQEDGELELGGMGILYNDVLLLAFIIRFCLDRVVI